MRKKRNRSSVFHILNVINRQMILSKQARVMKNSKFFSFLFKIFSFFNDCCII